MKLHTVVNRLLKEAHTTKYQFAKICGLPKSTVYDFLSGSHYPTPETLEQIAMGLGLKTWELMRLAQDVESIRK